MKLNFLSQIQSLLFPDPSRIAIVATENSMRKKLLALFLKNKSVQLLDTTKAEKIFEEGTGDEVVDAPFRLNDGHGFLLLTTRHCDANHVGAAQFPTRVLDGADGVLFFLHPEMINSGNGEDFTRLRSAVEGLSTIIPKPRAVAIAIADFSQKESMHDSNLFNSKIEDFRHSLEQAGISMEEIKEFRCCDSKEGAMAPLAWLADKTFHRTIWTRWRTWMLLVIAFVLAILALTIGISRGHDGGVKQPVVTPNEVAFDARCGSTNVQLTVSSNTQWTAKSDTNWIKVTSPTSGVGVASVYFDVTANPSSEARTGTLTLAEKTVTVSQAGFKEPKPTQSPLPQPPGGVKRDKDRTTAFQILEEDLKKIEVESKEPDMEGGLPKRLRPDMRKVFTQEEQREWKKKFSDKLKGVCDNTLEKWKKDSKITEISLLNEYASFCMKHGQNSHLNEVTEYVREKVGRKIIELAKTIENAVTNKYSEKSEKSAGDAFNVLNNLCTIIHGEMVQITPLANTWESRFAERYLGYVNKKERDFYKTWRQHITVSSIKLRVENSSKPYDVGISLSHKKWNRDKKKYDDKTEQWVLEPATKENKRSASEANSQKGDINVCFAQGIAPFDLVNFRMTVRKQGKSKEKVKTKFVGFNTGGNVIEELPVGCFQSFYNQQDNQGRAFRELVWEGPPESKGGKPVKVHCCIYGKESAIRLRQMIDEARDKEFKGAYH